MQRKAKTENPEFQGSQKDYTLQYFDYLQGEDENKRVIELNEKRREAQERAKRKF